MARGKVIRMLTMMKSVNIVGKCFCELENMLEFCVVGHVENGVLENPIVQ